VARRRRRNAHRHTPSAGGPPRPRASSPPADAAPRPPRPAWTGKRLWIARLALAVVVPLLLFTAAELILRLVGFGYPADFLIPANAPGHLTTNDHFAWFYHRKPPGSPDPFLVSPDRDPATLRVVVLGESAAMGTPDPAFGLPRLLQAMLESTYPDRRVQVLNAAIRGINSHMIVPIAAECATLHPDLFIVYMGNNELCGLYGPESLLAKYPALIGPIHTIRTTRVSQALTVLLNGPPDAPKAAKDTQTMEFFREHRIGPADPRKQPVYRNFRTNLDRICRIADTCSAATLVLTVPVNLRDFPPLGSLHRPDLSDTDLRTWQTLVDQGIQHEAQKNLPVACDAYRRALAIDDQYAELHFRLARCLLAAGDPDAAYEHFARARDCDALPFRTDSTINDATRRVVANLDRPTIRLVDAENLLRHTPLCPDTIPGSRAFRDHVHPTFAGDYHLARMILPAAVDLLRRHRAIEPTGPADPPTLDDCARRLAYTPLDEINTTAAMVHMTANPPFLDQIEHAQRQAQAQQAVDQAMQHVDAAFMESVLAAYRYAIAARPDDWYLRYNLATHLYQLKRYAEALPHITAVVERFPNRPRYRLCLAHALAYAGRFDQAAAQYRTILDRSPHLKAARDGLRWTLQQQTGPTSTNLPR